MSEYIKRTELEGRLYAATSGLLILDDADAEEFLDRLVDDVIAALRRDPRLGCLPAQELQLLLGNVRVEAARSLVRLVRGLSNIDHAIDEIVRELGGSRLMGKAKKTPVPDTEAATKYVTAWREQIAATSDPHSLLRRWRAERDLRDDLEIPVVQRFELLREIAPADVLPISKVEGDTP